MLDQALSGLLGILSGLAVLSVLGFLLAIAIFAACVAIKSLAAGADYAAVFKLVGVTAFGGYALALWQMSIWYRRAWSTTIKATIDGVVYALLTAGTFGWLWPR